MNTHPLRLRTYVLLLVLLGILPTARAQVAAPEFICTRSEAGDEVLTWNNVTSDCGAYQATEIYRAPAADGPYTLLATLTNPAETEYRDPNPNGEQLFYYLQYAYDCPGSAVVTSDTLDSFIPATPVVKFVSVVDGNLEIHWQPSSSPEVNRYVVLEVTDTGVNALDTVGLDTVYTVTGVPSNELTTRSYRVAALDACGNDSPQSSIVQAVSIEARGGAGCEVDIELVPLQAVQTSYLPLDPASGDTLTLYVSTNGGDFSAYESWTEADLPDTTDYYTYPAANDGDSLCFYFEMNYADISPNQRTEVYCQTVDITQPVRGFELFGVEVIDTGGVRLSYGYAAAPAGALPTVVQVLRDGQVLETVLPGGLSPNGEIFLPAGVGVIPGDSIRFSITDNCERVLISNVVTPVFLTVPGTNYGSPLLDWTALSNGLDGNVTYTVFRVDTTGASVPLLAGIDDLSYEDATNTGEYACYQIEASYTPAAGDTTYRFRSNVACTVPPAEVYLPNVFSPVANQDANRMFRPFFNLTAGISEYLMRVYDRWGALVFESENAEQGWDGTVGGQALPVGSYIYTISFTPAQGNIRELTGVVHLVR